MIRGETAALAVSACWAYNAFFFSKAGSRIGSFTVSHVRMWIAFPAAVAVNILVTGTLFPHMGASSFLFLALSGFVGYFLGDILLFESFVRIGPRLTMLIMSLAPIISAVLSFFVLGEKPVFIQWAAIVIAGTAVAWVISNQKNGVKAKHDITGYLLAFGGAIGQGAGMVLSKIGMEGTIPASSANVIRTAAGLLSFIVFTAVRRTTLRDMKIFAADKPSVVYVTSSTVIGPVLGVLLALYAIKTIYVGVALTLTSLSPLILIPVSHFMLNDRMSPASVFGTIAALGAISLFFFT